MTRVLTRRLVVLGTTAAVLAVPATAPAKAKPRSATANVTYHVAKANRALAQLRHHPRGRVAARALATSRNESAAAAAAAKRVKVRSVVTRAGVAWIVAAQSDQNLEVYTALLKRTTGTIQGQLATAVGQSADTRRTFIDALSSIAPSLPDAVKAQIVQAVSAMVGNDPAVMTALQSFLDGDSSGVDTVVATALGHLTGALHGSLDALHEIVATLPEGVRGPITDALDEVSHQLDDVIAQITQVLSGGFSADSGSATQPGDAGTPVFSLLPNVGQLIGTPLHMAFGLVHSLLGSLPIPGSGVPVGGATGPTGPTGSAGSHAPGSGLFSILGGFSGGAGGLLGGLFGGMQIGI